MNANNFSTLNPQQRLAVHTTDGPVSIIAGPGTGKTKTLTSRIQYLIVEKHIDPQKILAITFTKKAAEEMKERVGNTFVSIMTFHALGFEILSAIYDEIVLISDREKTEFIKEAAEKTNKKFFLKVPQREIELRISQIKNRIGFNEENLWTQLTVAYNHILKENKKFDYDDLVASTYMELQKSTQLQELWNNRFEYIMVDEFQDTNDIQYEIIKLLCWNNNICVIGDPYQSIYSFRGANGEIFSSFKKDFLNRVEIILNTNYRSSSVVITASSCIFPDGYTLYPSNEEQGTVQLVHTTNEYSEADFIATEICKRVGGVDLLQASDMHFESDEKINFRDFAIIFRTHAIGKELELAFTSSGIPYQRIGSDSLFERDYYDEHADKVTLLTMHAAKGLEFRYVFVCAFEEGVIPTVRADIEEEKRLLYVAMTRAKKSLYLLYARERRKKEVDVSRFKQLFQSCIQEVEDAAMQRIEKKREKEQQKKAQMSLFS